MGKISKVIFFLCFPHFPFSILVSSLLSSVLPLLFESPGNSHNFQLSGKLNFFFKDIDKEDAAFGRHNRYESWSNQLDQGY